MLSYDESVNDEEYADDEKPKKSTEGTHNAEGNLNNCSNNEVIFTLTLGLMLFGGHLTVKVEICLKK